MSLLSTHKSSDSGLTVNLHPLVLLTISDYITRHTLRQYTQPIVGGLIGLQTGRSVSLENAFEVKIIPDENGDAIIDDEYFKQRLEEYKAVHASPQLELVGWFTTAPVSGPETAHSHIHEYILQNHNETGILLAFHPSSVLGPKTAGGKLPLTIYESLYESVGESEDAMDTGEKEARLELRFRELPYSIETGEAEMIGVDYIARGGGNATAVDGAVKKEKKEQGEKSAAGKKEVVVAEDADALSVEDEERELTDSSDMMKLTCVTVISSLTARANAIKMLHSRIQLIKTYLETLPPSYLTTAGDRKVTQNGVNDSPPLDFPLLRSIQALLSRLPLLLSPSDLSNFNHENLAEKSEVGLVSLLGSVGQGVRDLQGLGSKFAVIESGKNSAKRSVFSQLPEGGFDDPQGNLEDMDLEAATRNSLFHQ